eukprot:3169234-Rhodomonas_salina.1
MKENVRIQNPFYARPVFDQQQGMVAQSPFSLDLTFSITPSVEIAAPAQRSASAASGTTEEEKGCDVLRPVSIKAKSGKKPSFWSKTEHEKFLEGLKKFGGHGDSVVDPPMGLGPGVAELISMLVGTRSVSQVRSHAQKYFIRLGKQCKKDSADA